MKWSLEVPDYSPEQGLRAEWEVDAQMAVQTDGDSLSIEANEAGLLALARLILGLANPDVPSGSHWHLDTFVESPIDIVIGKH